MLHTSVTRITIPHNLHLTRPSQAHKCHSINPTSKCPITHYFCMCIESLHSCRVPAPANSSYSVGSMGHIGGATLEKLIASHPELRITTLVRSDKDSAILKRQYEHANIKTQIGDLKDTEAMESLARNATIVLSVYPAQCCSLNDLLLITARLRSGQQSRPRDQGTASRPSGKRYARLLHRHFRSCQHLGSADGRG